MDIFSDLSSTAGTLKHGSSGLPLFLSFADMPGIVAVPAGALDEPSLFVPGLVSCATRALDRDPIDPALPSFEQMPPLLA